MDDFHPEDGIELQHVKKLTDDTVDTTGIQEVAPSDEGKVDHEDIDLPISQTADTAINEGVEDTATVEQPQLPESSAAVDDNNDDDTDLLIPSEIDVKMAPKLLRLQFPRVDEVHSSDVANVIKRKLERLNSRAGLLNEGPIDAFTVIYQSGLARQISWQAQVEEAVKDESDEFWQQVASKTQQFEMNRTDAIFEVYTDRIIDKTQDRDKALLWITSQEISEFSVELFVKRLLERGANTSAADSNLNTSLHYAAKKGWTSIAKTLMEHQSLPVVTNRQGLMPLELAIQNDHNECATFLVKSMEPEKVRNLFQGNEVAPSKLKFHTLLEKAHMQTTVLAVLDTMIQPLEGEHNTYIVYYQILDGDQHGRAPNCRTFDNSHKSCLHKIAKSNNKEVVYHDAVRLLLQRKWKKFARFRFFIQFMFFLIHTVILTVALVLAARKQDPRDYDEGVDVFRGICEALLLIVTMYTLLIEVYQLKKHKFHYFADPFNFLDIGAVLFPLMIIPFRITNLSEQWIFASLGYLSQSLRGFKYAAVFRSTGAYVQILSKIFIHDMIPFTAIFSIFLFSFTGAFYFALRGEERDVVTTIMSDAGNCSDIDDGNCTQNVATVTTQSNLDNFPYLTMEFYHVLFTNLRVMIEAEDIIDEYFGPNGFEWLSVIIYTIFLFLVITILLNLLIAQMSDTYTNVQSDAQRSLVINRAWIVARVEHNTLFSLDYRKNNYRSCEIVRNPHDILEKWEAPPINQVSKELTRLQNLMKQQETANNEFRITMMEALNEQKQLIRELISKQDNQPRS